MKYILTDIEGTTTSISFVHDVLFPYSKKRMVEFVNSHANELKVSEILRTIPGSLEEKIITLTKWIDEDKKEKPLKDIQGLIWEAGYLTGEIKGHVYSEVPEKISEWFHKGINLGVYSSGSVYAQKLLFKNSEAGDLDQFFTHNFDTSIGHKRETSSYLNILNIIKLPASEVLFLSDITEELDAAKNAGMHVLQLVRTEEVLNSNHQQVRNFSEIKI